VQPGASAGYRQRKLLYHNRGDGTFEETAGQSGPVMTDPRVGRGLAVGDLDNDGRLDVVVNNLDGSPEVLRNELPDRGNWLLVKLTGKGRNTDAIGALVTARAGTMTGIRLVQSGTSYLSQHDMRLHFGLGAAADVDSVEVRWPDGTTSTLHHVRANQIVTISQSR
jgi:enediyne biosynthesis protein E4